MITTQKDNLHSMIYAYCCFTITGEQHGSIITRYNFNKHGAYEMQKGTEVIKLPPPALEMDANGLLIAKEDLLHKSYQYSSVLEDCISAVQKEIENNIVSIRHLNTEYYITSLYREYSEKIKFNKEQLSWFNSKDFEEYLKQLKENSPKSIDFARISRTLQEDLQFWEIQNRHLSYFLNWLKNHPILLKVEVNEGIDQEETLKDKVEKVFAFMKGNDPRKHLQILTDTEFKSLVTWVTFYFENDLIIPEILKPIQKVNTNKGNVIYTFMRFFKVLHPTKTRPDSLFNLIQACFHEYRIDKLENLKKTKRPQYYDQLASKG